MMHEFIRIDDEYFERKYREYFFSLSIFICMFRLYFILH